MTEGSQLAAGPKEGVSQRSQHSGRPKIKIANKSMDIEYLFKIIIIGDAGVGKSNILIRYTKNEFDASNKPTIGIEFSSKTIDVSSKKVKLQIWDTAGQERYRAVAKQYYKGASGVMIVYDTTKKQSFENLSK